MNKPDIGVFYEEGISSDLFEGFKTDLNAEGLNLVVESREPTGPMACPEWYIFPAVAVFVASAYFNGFLREMGKDHYDLLKDKISNLSTKVMKTPRIEPTLFGTEGKLSLNNPYSQALSILAEAENGYTFKLLIPKANSSADYNLITHRFMDFLSDYYLGLQSLKSIGCSFENGKPPSNMIFVHYNEEKDCIEWLDEKEWR